MKLLEKYNIKTKLSILSMLQILLPIIIIGVVSLVLSVKIIKSLEFSLARSRFDFISTEISNYTRDIYQSTQNLLCNKKIYDAVAFSDELDGSAKNDIQILFQKTVSSAKGIDAAMLVIGSEPFTVSAENSRIHAVGTVGYNKIKQEAEKRRGMPYWRAISANSETTGIMFARAIYNPYTSETAGLLVYQLSASTFTDFLHRYNTQTGRHIAIISDNGDFAFREKEFEIPSECLRTAATSKNSSSFVSVGSAYAMYKQIPYFDWSILYYIEKASLFRSIYGLAACVILLSMLSATLLFLFTDYINSNICTPLSRLSHSMNTWKEHLHVENSYSKRPDEIGILYRSFDSMNKAITELIDINYKNEILRRDSELKMLQSQINPHFLFNTLEVINSLALLNNVPQINDVVSSLSDILNHSIMRDDRNIPLREELSLVDSYLYIFSVRFEDAYDVSCEIDPKTENILIPNLTVQPVVENAVKHGIIPAGRKCHLNIKTFLSGGDLIVDVSDDGAGIGAQKLGELNKSLSDGGGKQTRSIGLLNVNKRLKLLYGSDYGITVDSRENVFTRVSIKFKNDLRGIGE